MVAFTVEDCAGARTHYASARQSRLDYGRIVQLCVERLIRHTLEIDPARLSLPSRGSRPVIFARHLSMYLAVVEGGLSYIACGHAFSRDRRSVAYAVARIERGRDDNPALDACLDRLGDSLRRAIALNGAEPNTPSTLTLDLNS